MKIEVLQSTENTNALLHDACMITQKKRIKDIAQTIRYLVSANHTSMFEHMSMTLLITSVSRSFLAQITRHRIASYTASSQHYQEYDIYPNVMCNNMAKSEAVRIFCKETDTFYNILINSGVPKEEARQILIGAKAVNIIWTINARSLMNFLNLRLCKRNVKEMYLFGLIGPDFFIFIHIDSLNYGFIIKMRKQPNKSRLNFISQYGFVSLVAFPHFYYLNNLLSISFRQITKTKKGIINPKINNVWIKS